MNILKNKRRLIFVLAAICIFLVTTIIFFNMKRNSNDENTAGEIKEESTKSDIVSSSTTVSTSSSTTVTTSTTTSRKPTSTTKRVTTTTKQTTSKASEVVKVVESTTSKGYKIEYIDGAYYIGGILVSNKSYPLDKNYIPKGTHKQASSSTTHCAECIIEDGYKSFQKMKEAISNEGITLWIQSGYRSYSLQDSLYNGYVKRSGKSEADTYSARPGHSEHQTGYAFDVCASKNGKNYPCITSSFNDTEPALWLKDNCYKYGFILRYPAGKESETGYKHESWHFRYVGVDLATKLYNNGSWLTLEDYLGIDSKYEN